MTTTPQDDASSQPGEVALERPVRPVAVAHRFAIARTVYCFSTGGEAALTLRSFDDSIRFVMPDGSAAQVYYRIQPDGEGVLVCQRASEPQVFCIETNSGLFGA